MKQIPPNRAIRKDRVSDSYLSRTIIIALQDSLNNHIGIHTQFKMKTRLTKCQ